MADSYDGPKVITRLVTEGGDQVRQDLRDNEQAAAAAQRKLDAMQRTVGTVRKPQTPGEMVAQIAKATGERPEDIQRALGYRAMTTAGAGRAQIADPGISKMMMAMGGASARSRMIEGMSGAGFQQDQLQKLAVKEAIQQEADKKKAGAEALKQQALLTQQTEQAWKGMGRLGQSLTGVGFSAGAGGPIGVAVGGLLAGGVALEKLFGFTKETVGIRDPARAYFQERAELDLKASIGRGLTPMMDEMTHRTRQMADFAYAHPEAIEAGGKGLLSMVVPTWTQKVLGKTLDWLAYGKEDLSRNAAPDAMLGRHLPGGDDVYLGIAGAGLRALAEKDLDAPASEMKEAVGKFSIAVDKMIDVAGVFKPPSGEDSWGIAALRTLGGAGGNFLANILE